MKSHIEQKLFFFFFKFLPFYFFLVFLLVMSVSDEVSTAASVVMKKGKRWMSVFVWRLMSSEESFGSSQRSYIPYFDSKVSSAKTFSHSDSKGLFWPSETPSF